MKTCQLLQMVLLAKILKGQTDADDWPGRLENMKSNQTEIKKQLEEIGLDGKIKIYFLPEAPALQYCIHNAGDIDRAIMYLKSEEGFIEWESKRPAHQFWCEVREAQGVLEPDPPCAVFYGAPGFKINEGTFFRTLKQGQ